MARVIILIYDPIDPGGLTGGVGLGFDTAVVETYRLFPRIDYLILSFLSS